MGKKINDTRNIGEKVADGIAKFGGSWSFIISFFCVLVVWMAYNSDHFFAETFDPYPFILLNLVLSCLAAIQAPIIMMSNNRQAAKDRCDAKKDLSLSEDIDHEVHELRKEIRILMQALKKD